MQFSSGMVWLKVHLAGRTEPLNFLLDSGAGASVISTDAARQAGLKLGRAESVQGVHGRSVAYRVEGISGKIGITPVASSMLALDLRSVSFACGRKIDGLIGADFFRDRIVQIDYSAAKVRLLNRAEASHIGGNILPLARRHDAWCVRVGVAGQAPEWMRLDTGCNSAIEWVLTASNARKLTATAIGLATRSSRSIQADVALGSERLPGVKVGVHQTPIFSGESGLLGNGVLSRFVVTIDEAKGRLTLAAR